MAIVKELYPASQYRYTISFVCPGSYPAKTIGIVYKQGMIDLGYFIGVPGVILFHL
jgi:hypothetical protein